MVALFAEAAAVAAAAATSTRGDNGLRRVSGFSARFPWSPDGELRYAPAKEGGGTRNHGLRGLQSPTALRLLVAEGHKQSGAMNMAIPPSTCL